MDEVIRHADNTFSPFTVWMQVNGDNTVYKIIPAESGDSADCANLATAQNIADLVPHGSETDIRIFDNEQLKWVS